ncbi:MAG: hypothetical protein ACSLFI_11205 [Solirubrobacterales bacterium]
MPIQVDEHNVFEVFAQFGGSGKPVQYIGSVRGSDAVLAWQAAKEVYTRREDCTLLWVAPRSSFMVSAAEDALGLGRGSTRRYRVPNFPSAHRRARNSRAGRGEEISNGELEVG